MTSEAELVKKAAAGDCLAFEALVRKYEKPAFNIAMRMLGNVQDAEDATQEVFIKVYNSLNSFRGESKFSVWFYRIATNVCIDFFRKKRPDTVSLSAKNEDGENFETELADESMSPETVFERRERNEALQSAMRRLPEGYRSILLLREIGGGSYEEIAAVLGLDMGTVKSRIFRARKKLCEILTADGNFFEDFPSDKGKGGEQA